MDTNTQHQPLVEENIPQDDGQHREDVHRQKGERALRKYKKFAWFFGICGLLLLLIGIIMPIVLYNFILSQARDEVVMQPSNFDQWGQIPGDTGMVMNRQFTFYNFTNSEDFFMRGAKPILYESEPVYYQEYQNFTNPVFNDDKSQVNYSFQEYFLPINNSTGKEIQTTVNLGPMGFWYQIKSATRVQIGIQAFYGIISGMIEQIYDTLQGVTVIAEVSVKSSFFAMLAENTQMLAIEEWLYSDPNYGIHGNPYFWIMAAKEFVNGLNPDVDLSTNVFLCNYFKLNYQSIEQFWMKNQQKFLDSFAFSKQVFDGINCNYPKEEDTRLCLAACQWTTLQPNMGESITTNNTALGYPEIVSFQQGYFKLYIDASERYQNIEFNMEWAMKVIYYIQNPVDNKDYTRNTNTLINQGNLDVLYTNGALYDQTNDPKYLQIIADRFEINETYFGTDYLDAAYLFWEYSKYIVDIFAEMKNYKNGGSAVAGLTGVASQGLYTVFSQTQDALAIQIITVLMLGGFGQGGITDCAKFNLAVAARLQQDVQLCTENSPFTAFDSNSMKVLYECYTFGSLLSYCNYVDEKLFPTVKNFFSALSSLDFIQQVVGGTDLVMFNQFQCSAGIQKCSYYEIAAKQWYNQFIIRNLPASIEKYFPPGRDSLAQWNPHLPHAFEWGYYAEKFADTFDAPPDTLTWDQISNLLGFNMLFSGSRLTQLFLIDENFAATFYYQNPSQIRDYLRWITVFTAFGLTQTRPAEDLLSGYADDFLINIAEMNPQEGGDPSTTYFLNFNDINMTSTEQFQPQGMYTGKGNVDQVRQYTNVAGLDYITFVKPVFDGFSEPVNTLVTPWATNIPIVGTDAGANQPNLGKNTDLNIYVTTLYTGGEIKNSGIETNFEGLNTYKYEISGCILRNATVCPQNADVYAYDYDYSINLTSIQGAPIFNTKTHMYQMQPPMSERITLYNKDGNLQYPSEWDDTYILVEPITGTSLSITLNLQGVLLFTPDFLFTRIKEPVMIPFFYCYRAGNFTSAKVDDIFGVLKAGLLIKDLILYIGCSLGGILLLGFIYSAFAIYKLKKHLSKFKAQEIKDNMQQSENYL